MDTVDGMQSTLAEDDLQTIDFDFISENSSENIWCEQCKVYKKRIEKQQEEHALSFSTLKKKIISTDLLIRKYKSKCDDYDLQTKRLEETTKKVECSQREAKTLQAQLTSSLQQIEPAKQEKLFLESEIKKKNKEIQLLQDKVVALENVQKQYEQLNKSLTEDKEKNETVTKENARKVKDLEASSQRQESQISKLREEQRLLKKEIAKNAKIKKKNEEKLLQYRQILVENGLLPKGDRSLGTLKVKRESDPDESFEDVTSQEEDEWMTSQDKSENSKNSTTMDKVKLKSNSNKSISTMEKGKSNNKMSSTDITKSNMMTLTSDLIEDESVKNDHDDDNDSMYSFPFSFSPLVKVLSPLPPSPICRNDVQDCSDDDLDEMADQLEKEFLQNSPTVRRSPRKLIQPSPLASTSILPSQSATTPVPPSPLATTKVPTSPLATTSFPPSSFKLATTSVFVPSERKTDSKKEWNSKAKQVTVHNKDDIKELKGIKKINFAEDFNTNNAGSDIENNESHTNILNMDTKPVLTGHKNSAFQVFLKSNTTQDSNIKLATQSTNNVTDSLEIQKCNSDSCAKEVRVKSSAKEVKVLEKLNMDTCEASSFFPVLDVDMEESNSSWSSSKESCVDVNKDNYEKQTIRQENPSPFDLDNQLEIKKSNTIKNDISVKNKDPNKTGNKEPDKSGDSVQTIKQENTTQSSPVLFQKGTQLLKKSVSVPDVLDIPSVAVGRKRVSSCSQNQKNTITRSPTAHSSKKQTSTMKKESCEKGFPKSANSVCDLNSKTSSVKPAHKIDTDVFVSPRQPIRLTRSKSIQLPVAQADSLCLRSKSRSKVPSGKKITNLDTSSDSNESKSESDCKKLDIKSEMDSIVPENASSREKSNDSVNMSPRRLTRAMSRQESLGFVLKSPPVSTSSQKPEENCLKMSSVSTKGNSSATESSSSVSTKENNSMIESGSSISAEENNSTTESGLYLKSDDSKTVDGNESGIKMEMVIKTESENIEDKTLKKNDADFSSSAVKLETRKDGDFKKKDTDIDDVPAVTGNKQNCDHSSENCVVESISIPGDSHEKEDSANLPRQGSMGFTVAGDELVDNYPSVESGNDNNKNVPHLKSVKDSTSTHSKSADLNNCSSPVDGDQKITPVSEESKKCSNSYSSVQNPVPSRSNDPSLVYIPSLSKVISRSALSGVPSSTVVSPEIADLTQQGNRSATPRASSSMSGKSPVSPLPPSPIDFFLPTPISPLPPSPARDTVPISPLLGSPLEGDLLSSAVSSPLTVSYRGTPNSDRSDEQSPPNILGSFLITKSNQSGSKRSGSSQSLRKIRAGSVPCSFHAVAPPDAITVKPQKNKVQNSASRRNSVDALMETSRSITPDGAVSGVATVNKKRTPNTAKKRRSLDQISDASTEKKKCLSKKNDKKVGESCNEDSIPCHPPTDKSAGNTDPRKVIETEMTLFVSRNSVTCEEITKKLMSIADLRTVSSCLFQWTVQNLKCTQMEMFAMIHCFCAYGDGKKTRTEPFLTQEETRTLQLYSFLFKTPEWMALRHELLEILWQAIFSKDLVTQCGRLALCRIFVGLLHEAGDMEHVRVFFFHVMKCAYFNPALVAVTIASLWPQCLYRNSDCASPVIVVMESCIMKDLKENQEKDKKIMVCLQKLCNWLQPIHDNKALLNHLLFDIEQKCESCPENTGHIYELEKAVELLLILQKAGFFKTVFFGTAVNNILNKLKPGRKKPNPEYVKAVIRITGRILCHIGLEPQDYDQMKYVTQVIKKNVIKILYSDLASTDVQECVVTMLLELAFLSPVAIMSSGLYPWFKSGKANISSELVKKMDDIRKILTSKYPSLRCPPFA